MKKLLVLLVAVSLALSQVAYAKMTRMPDEFTGGVRVGSMYYFKEPSDTVAIIKILSNGSAEYEFTTGIMVPSGKMYQIVKTEIEIKVNENPTLHAPISEVTNYEFGGVAQTGASAQLSASLIEQLKTAKRIAIKIPTGTSSRVIILPTLVIQEWQQVIATEK